MRSPRGLHVLLHTVIMMRLLWFLVSLLLLDTPDLITSDYLGVWVDGCVTGWVVWVARSLSVSFMNVCI